MKHNISIRKTVWIPALVVLVIAIAGLVIWRQWYDKNYDRLHIERTLTSELKHLQSPLTSLGFTDLTNLDTTCSYRPSSPEMLDWQSDVYQCDSKVNRYTLVATDDQGKKAFNGNAMKLHDTLKANGWTSREDYPTIPWFQKISEGVDYQPDQLNTKTVNGLDCVIDFYTAFSKPKPAAISMQAYCSKPL